jgi:hypothetical protein
VRLYLAGPISSNLGGYKAQFAQAAEKLRAEGWTVINPAENPPQPTWAAYMRVSIGQLVMCDEIALMQGWRKSRGARVERFVARVLGMPVVYL